MSETIRIRCQGAFSLPYKELTPFQGELKMLTKERYEALRKQIVETGFRFAPHCWKDPRDGLWYLIDGHQRLRTIKEMVEHEGWLCPPLPVVPVEADSYQDAKRAVLQGVAQFGEVQSQGLYEFTTEADIHFDELQYLPMPEIPYTEFVDEYYGDLPGGTSEGEDDVPEPKADPKVKLGDGWNLGNHKLLCGDSTDLVHVERLMGGKKTDMAFTSPPYNLGVSAKLRGNTEIGKRGNVYEQYDDDKTEDEWMSLVSKSTDISLKYSRYSFWNIQPLAGNRSAIWKYASNFSDRYCDIFVWDKLHAPPQQAERVINSRFELIWCFTSDDNPTRAIRIAPAFRGTIDNVFTSQPQRNNENADVHGATFPVYFPEHFINSFCPLGGGVLDLFGGSGSTLIACEKTNRRCFMMEIDPVYCGVILDRWAQFTGKDPLRASDGAPWSVVSRG